MAEIWNSVQSIAEVFISGIEPNQIEAIGITNQRSDFSCWDKNTGNYFNACLAIGTTPLAEELKNQGYVKTIRQV